MPQISIIYISNRYGGLDILRANLARQTFTDFEVIFVDGLYSKRKDIVADYFKDYNLKHIDDSHIPLERFYSKLARLDNLAFKNCSGDLIVCLQDYIYIPYDALEKFMFVNNLYENKALITGIGSQYKYPGANEIANKEGLISIFEKDYTKKPENRFWQDPRDNGQKMLRDAYPVEWELNFASIPKNVIYDLGGMDEAYDSFGFAFDNTNIAERAKILGYKIVLDGSNECYGFDHDTWWPNPLKINKVSPINYHLDIIGRMKRGEVSARLKYLP